MRVDSRHIQIINRSFPRPRELVDKLSGLFSYCKYSADCVFTLLALDTVIEFYQ